jgi:hypothetical protein
MDKTQALQIIKHALDISISAGAIKTLKDAQTLAIALSVVENEINSSQNIELQNNNKIIKK